MGSSLVPAAWATRVTPRQPPIRARRGPTLKMPRRPPLTLPLATTTLQLAATLAAAASATAALPRPISQPLPFPYTGFDRFPAFYFGSRPEGLQDEGQLEVMARHSLVGWGWEQGLGPHCESCNGYKPTAPLDALHYCSSEQRLSESATRFRSYLEWGPPSRDSNLTTTPPTDAATKPIFVYRNFVYSLHFYSLQRASYSRPELFPRNDKGEVCLGKGNGSPFWCARRNIFVHVFLPAVPPASDRLRYYRERLPDMCAPSVCCCRLSLTIFLCVSRNVG